MGDGDHDLKQAYRHSSSQQSGTLDEKLTTPDPKIITSDASLTPASPGFARRVLSSAYYHTLGRLYQPQQAPETASLDASVEQVLREEQSPTYAAEGQTPEQGQATTKRGRFLLRNRREATHLALGVGATVLGYEVFPSASGLVHQVRVAVYETATPVIEVVSQNPLGASAGLILAPALTQRYLQSRNSRLSRAGIAVTAVAGAGVGIALGGYGPEVVSAMYQFIAAHPLQVIAGSLGAAAPLVNYVTASRNERRGFGRVAVQSAASAGVGVGLSYALPIFSIIQEKVFLAASAVGKTIGSGVAIYYPEILAAVGSAGLAYTGMRVFSPNSSRTTRAAVTLGAGIAGVGALQYLPAIVDGAASLWTRASPSLETLVGGLSEAGAAGVGALIFYGLNRFWPDLRKMSGRRALVEGAVTGVVAYNFQYYNFGSEIIHFFGSHLAELGIAGAVVGTTAAFVKSQRLRTTTASSVQDVGRKVAKGAVYTARTFNRTLNTVTPSPEFVRDHPGLATKSLLAVGAGLAVAAATMEPVKDAVVHSISAGDVGLAALTAAAAISVGMVINDTVKVAKTYISGRRR